MQTIHRIVRKDHGFFVRREVILIPDLSLKAKIALSILLDKESDNPDGLLRTETVIATGGYSKAQAGAALRELRQEGFVCLQQARVRGKKGVSKVGWVINRGPVTEEGDHHAD